MHPSWGGYGGGPQPPPHFGPRPHQFRGAQPPSAAAPAQAAAGGGFGGYGAPSVQASSNFSSLHEQHLQQMQQLQQLHQKQLQSVLHHSGNNNTSSGPAPYWQAGGAPPNTFQDPSTQRGPAGQPQPPPPEVKPPAPEPTSSSLSAAPVPQVSETSSSVADEKPDFSSMSQQASFSCISFSSSSSSSY